MVGHDTGDWAATQPHDTARMGHDTAGSARAWLGWWSVSQYNCCIVTGARALLVRTEKILIFGKRVKSSFRSKSRIFLDLG